MCDSPPPLPLRRQVIDLAEGAGGDVMKFAGDAIVVAFRPTREEQQAEAGQGSEAGLRCATLRAAACAHELVQAFGERRAGAEEGCTRA